jgi:hypothetical protein
MLTRLLFALTLALVFAATSCSRGSPPSPAVADARYHGGSGIVGPMRVGDLNVGVSTEADVRAFAGNPDSIDKHPGIPGHVVLRYDGSGRDGGQTYYEIDRVADEFVGFDTFSKRFRTRRGTRVGDTRDRAEHRERHKADARLCSEGDRAILRIRHGRYFWIFFERRRVVDLLVDDYTSWTEC